MKTVILSLLATLLVKSSMAHPRRAVVDSESLSPRYLLDIREQGTDCGPGYGSCDPGLCCSESGWCGSTEAYCDGSSCQLDYCDSCDTFHQPSGESTESIPRPQLGSVPYGSIITECTQEGVVALAFDDGPYNYTSQILDTLDEYDVLVTFFITGNNLGKGQIDDLSLPWADLLKRMHTTGHHIGHHTWTHRDLDEMNSTIQHTEMIYNEMAFRNIFGWFPTYMRPPYLDCSTSTGCLPMMDTLGYHVITCNIDTKDYENDSPDLIQTSKDRFSSALATDPSSSSYIILAHDIHEQTVSNLTAYMITTAQNLGYKIVSVAECLGDPKENWYRSAVNASTSAAASSTTASSTTVSSSGGSGSTSSSTSTHPSTHSSSSSSTKARTSSTSSIAATSTSGVKISPNQECGGEMGYTCKGSKFGNCCSAYGYCGSTSAYCGTGCDVDFGECDSSTAVKITDTTNGLCGATYRSTCKNFGSKTCCSKYGYCGNTNAYCDSGCQSKYGKCH